MTLKSRAPTRNNTQLYCESLDGIGTLNPFKVLFVLTVTHRPLSSSFLGFIFRIL